MREFLHWFIGVGGAALLALILVGLFGNDPAGWLSAKAERLAAQIPNPISHWRKR